MLTLVVAKIVANRDEGIATVRDSKLNKAAYVHLRGEEAYNLRVNSYCISYIRHSKRACLGMQV